MTKCEEVMRLKHYSYHIGQTDIGVIHDFVRFHKPNHPDKMGVAETRDYLSYLAVERNVAASTQNVAFNALLSPLYSDVLDIQLPAITMSIVLP